MSKIFLEILNEPRKVIFDKLAVFNTYGYLSGGTALALQLNHRISFDFDVFVRNPIGNQLKLKVKFVFGSAIQFMVNSQDQITFETPEGVEITFLWYYFPSIEPLISTRSLPLASLEDIAASKANTIGRRAVWRDYVDIFYLIKHHGFTLADIVNFAKKKFGGEFVEIQFLQQLCYFEDLTIVKIDWIHTVFEPEDIKSFLFKSVKTYMIGKTKG